MLCRFHSTWKGPESDPILNNNIKKDKTTIYLSMVQHGTAPFKINYLIFFSIFPAGDMNNPQFPNHRFKVRIPAKHAGQNYTTRTI